MSEKAWVTVYRHKGFEIQVLTIAENPNEFGYRIDSPAFGDRRFNLVADAVQAIDDMTRKGW